MLFSISENIRVSYSCNNCRCQPTNCANRLLMTCNQQAPRTAPRYSTIAKEIDPIKVDKHISYEYINICYFLPKVSRDLWWNTHLNKHMYMFSRKFTSRFSTSSHTKPIRIPFRISPGFHQGTTENQHRLFHHLRQAPLGRYKAVRRMRKDGLGGEHLTWRWKELVLV